MMQYGHVYTAFCIIIKLNVMFWKLYTRIDFNVGTFKIEIIHIREWKITSSISVKVSEDSDSVHQWSGKLPAQDKYR